METGSSVPRRSLGRYLRLAREEARISLEAAARDLEWSKAKMYRIEGGLAPLRRLDVMAMCSLYQVPAEHAEVMISLAAETKAKGWWQAYGEVVPSWFDLYLSMEAASDRLRNYESVVIPGLLQIPEYAEAVFRTRPGVTEAEVERRVALRMERKKQLDRKLPPPLQLDVIVDEGALRRPIADRAAMQRQLAHLVNVTVKRPNIRVRAMPLSAGPHLASGCGAFVIMDFAAVGLRQPEPTTIYSQNITGALYLDKPVEVAAYEHVWEVLEGLVLDGRATDDLIAEIIKENGDD